MGLYIVAELTKLLDGRLQLHSDVGQGTTVTLTLPFAIPRQRSCMDTEARIADMLSGTTLLLVEDEPSICRLITEMLAPLGIAVYTAGTAGEALQQIDALLPDIILADLHLPDLSGLPLAQRLSSQAEQQNLATPLIVMTASTNPELHAQLADTAIAATLIKPINREKLIATLHAHQDQATSPKHDSEPPTPPTPALDEEMINAHREMLGEPALSALVTQYDTAVQTYLRDLTVAVSEMKKERIVFLAHKIAGLSASLGLRGVSTLAEQIESGIDNLGREALSTMQKELERINADSLTEITSRLTASPPQNGS
jgi:DNA-binding response OmpR family regulator